MIDENNTANENFCLVCYNELSELNSAYYSFPICKNCWNEEKKSDVHLTDKHSFNEFVRYFLLNLKNYNDDYKFNIFEKLKNSEKKYDEVIYAKIIRSFTNLANNLDLQEKLLNLDLSSSLLMVENVTVLIYKSINEENARKWSIEMVYKIFSTFDKDKISLAMELLEKMDLNWDEVERFVFFMFNRKGTTSSIDYNKLKEFERFLSKYKEYIPQFS